MKTFKSILAIVALFVCLIGHTAWATVSSSASRVQYNCNGALTGFSFTFGVNETEEIQVILTNSTGTETTLTETTHYTVSCTNNDCSAGGTVTTVSTYASGNTLTLLRNVPLTQEADFTENMPALYETFEDGLDKLTRIDQQFQEQITRTPKIAKSSSHSATAYTFPDPDAGKVIGWNAGATNLTTFSTSSATTLDISTVARIGDYGNNLATAIAAIGATEKTLLIDVATSGTTTVPQNVILWFIKGGSLTSSVTIYAPSNISAQSNQQIFSGAGTVAFSVTGNVYANWWGMSISATAANNATYLGSALTAVGAGGTVKIAGGSYALNPVTISTNQTTLESDNPYGQSVTLTYASGTGTLISISGMGCKVRGFSLVGPTAAAGNGDIGIKVTDPKSRCVIEHNVLAGFDIGFHDDGWLNTWQFNTISTMGTYGLLVDSGSSGSSRSNYFSGTTNAQCFHYHGTAWESYSDHFESATYGAYISSGSAVTFTGPHFEGNITQDIYLLDATCTITINGGRLTGTLRAPAGGSGANWIFNGTYFNSTPTFTNFTTSSIYFNNTSLTTFSNLFTGAIASVRSTTKEILSSSAADAVTVTTGEDDLKTATIPQNIHNAYAGFTVRASGTKTGANGNKTIKFYIGTDAVTFNAAANDTNDWKLEATVLFVSAAVHRVSLVGYNGTTIVQDYSTSTANLSAADVTTKITGECANAGDVITQTMWRVDLLPKAR